MGKSKLLFNKIPLIIDPDLAVLIGLNESIVIQQVHYWLKINEESNRNFRDGHFWTYNTYNEWQKQFPFWNISTIKRVFASLEKKGYLISDNYNKLKVDRTKWYRIDYSKLKTLETPPLYQNDTLQSVNMARPIPEITTEINNKVNNGHLPMTALSFCSFMDNYLEGISNPDIILAVEYYLDKYKEHTGQDHPNLKPDQWQNVADNILIFDRETKLEDITLEQIEPVIDRHFATKYDNCDYNILHFVSGDIIRHRVYEEGNY